MLTEQFIPLSGKIPQHEIDCRFSYHKPKEGQPEKFVSIRDNAKALANIINNECPPCRETSLALTKLDEVVMFANAAIARRS